MLSLLERGIAKSNTDMASEEMKNLILSYEEVLKSSKIGVWEWSDEEEDNDSLEND